MVASLIKGKTTTVAEAKSNIPSNNWILLGDKIIKIYCEFKEDTLLHEKESIRKIQMAINLRLKLSKTQNKSYIMV
jgi:hypothetical protein